MANPQAENGHTDIAHDYLEKLMKANLTGAQYQIMLAVIRKTWGWKKKRDKISYGQLVKMTGLHRQTVLKELKRLVANKLLVIVNKLPVNLIELQKDYDQWVVVNRLLVANKRLGSSLQATKTSSLQATHKRKERNYTKEKTFATFFESFWENYPKRNGKKLLKKDAYNYFCKNIKESEFKNLILATKNYAKSKTVQENFAKDAVRWLRNWQEWLEPELENKQAYCCLSDGTLIATKEELQQLEKEEKIEWSEREQVWKKVAAKLLD